jgi:hypothetical protein
MRVPKSDGEYFEGGHIRYTLVNLHTARYEMLHRASDLNPSERHKQWNMDEIG